MKHFCVFLLALLKSMACLGFPAYNSELESIADKALGSALAEVNSVYAASRLYRVTRGSVTKVVPAGVNAYDLTIKFGVKETVCPRNSTEDPQRCAFGPGFLVPFPVPKSSPSSHPSYPFILSTMSPPPPPPHPQPSASCSSRVRVSSYLSRVLSLTCGQDSSSSSEESSSEEKFSRKRQYNVPTSRNRGRTTSTPLPVIPRQPVHRQDQEVQLRGDTFDNYLV